MKGRNLDIRQVIKSLARKKIIVLPESRTIDMQYAENAGNGSWGMIDFLVNHNKYRIVNRQD